MPHGNRDSYGSKGLNSLFNLLQSYEGESGQPQPFQLQENQSGLVATTENTKFPSKRYIWDDENFLNVDGHPTSSFSEKPSLDEATLTSGISNFKSKIKHMQDELKKKTVYVDELKTTLARKKLAKERAISKLKVEWVDKIEKLKGEFENVSEIDKLVNFTSIK